MDNTVGSLTQLQLSLVLGTVLGDGYLRMFSGRSNALLEINHSIEQKAYVEWKYAVLQNIAGGVPSVRNNNGGRIVYRFYTKQLPELTDMLMMFYRDGRKVIPDSLILNPFILAVWFMDDGSKCSDSDFYLNTQQYSLIDQQKLIDKLSVLKLETRLNKDKMYWRLRFLKSLLPHLKALIGSLVIPSMQYKLN